MMAIIAEVNRFTLNFPSYHSSNSRFIIDQGVFVIPWFVAFRVSQSTSYLCSVTTYSISTIVENCYLCLYAVFIEHYDLTIPISLYQVFQLDSKSDITVHVFINFCI